MGRLTNIIIIIVVKTDGDFLGCTGGIGEADSGVGEIFGGIENPFVFIANLLYFLPPRGEVLTSSASITSPISFLTRFAAVLNARRMSMAVSSKAKPFITA